MSEPKSTHNADPAIEVSLPISHIHRSHTQMVTLSDGEHHHYVKHIGNHGTETFEDVMFHPIREWKAHKKRREQAKLRAASGITEPEKDVVDVETGEIVPTPKEIIIHIKEMNGKHTFKFEEKDLDILATGIHLLPEEKESFRHIANSDDLRRHCIETHRAVRMKFDSDIEPSNDIKIISLNDNVFLEIKEVDFDNELETGFKNERRRFFKPPDVDLSDNNLGEKQAEWLELFYDLFYIVSLSQFTHTHHIIDGYSFLIYAGWFVILWWAWMSSALYTTRFDTNDVVHHIFKLIEMYGIVGMAGSSANYYSTDTKGFIISYMILKSILVLEYGVVYYFAFSKVKKPESILPIRFFLLVNILSLAMWGGSLSVEVPGRYGLWYGSIAVEVFVNVWFRHNKETSVAKSQLGERIGLLTLIVLGENVIGLVRLLASESHIILIICEMMGVTILFSFFYIYFDDFSKEVLAEAKLNYLWIFAHFPLHLFQISVGSALTDLISIERTALGEPAVPVEKVISHFGTLSDATTTEPVANSTSVDSTPLTTEGGEPLNLNPRFVEVTFLVSAALVLFVNALIKMLHSQLAQKSSVIIIIFRVFNVVILLVLIAVPYEMWGGALPLLGFMTGLMILQVAVDYLD